MKKEEREREKEKEKYNTSVHNKRAVKQHEVERDAEKPALISPAESGKEGKIQKRQEGRED